jgi:hypothetical protein
VFVTNKISVELANAVDDEYDVPDLKLLICFRSKAQYAFDEDRLLAQPIS